MKPLLAFVAPPYAGHLNTILFLALTAQRAGHRVEVITGPSRIALVERLGLTAHCPPLLAGGVLEAVPETKGSMFDNPLRLWRTMQSTFALLQPLRDHLIARWQQDPPAAAIADFTAAPAGLAAQILGLPWITVVAPAFVIVTRDGPPPYLGGWHPGRGPLGRLRDRLGWWVLEGAMATIYALHRRTFRKLGFRRLRPDRTEAVYSPHCILAPALPQAEFSAKWPPALRFIGPVQFTPETPDAPPLSLPDGPAVLVTFGTLVPWAKDQMIRETLALARRLPGVHFVVSRGEGTRAADPPDHPAPNVQVQGFVPYDRDLGRFAAVIHHGGAGIATACLRAAIPALVCPRDFDQPDAAARIAHFNLGHRIRRIDSARSARLLAALLHSPPAGLAPMARIAASYDPAAQFLRHLNQLISQKDPAHGDD